MKKLLIIFLSIFLLIPNLSLALEFKKIKKEAVVTNSKIIFPTKSNKDTCVGFQLLQPTFTLDPIPTLDAPKGYGLDDRFDRVRQQFEKFSMPCGLGDVKSCEKVKEIILNWAKADAPKRTGPKNGESKFWNDTLTINLHINNPMMSGYSFARQVIDFSVEEEKIIKEWFKRSVKRGAHLMYEKKKDEIITKGLSVIKNGKYEYPITAQLIKDGRKNKILSKKLKSKIKVTMVHGGKDEVVPVSFSRKVLFVFPNAQKKLVKIKNGNHSLSNKMQLKKIIKELNSIVEDVI